MDGAIHPHRGQPSAHPAVRVVHWRRTRNCHATQCADHFIAAMQRVLDQTAGTGVDLAMENHGAFGNSPLFLDEVSAAVGDPRLGMTLDIANFYWWESRWKSFTRCSNFMLRSPSTRTSRTSIIRRTWPRPAAGRLGLREVFLSAGRGKHRSPPGDPDSRRCRLSPRPLHRKRDAGEVAGRTADASAPKGR